MSDRLERLLKLAAKTGDRLIVHDPSTAHDMVIMDVESYEQLVFSHERPSVERLTGEELVDQINKDIALWRSGKTEEEFEDLTERLIDEMIHHPSMDPFSEDFSHGEEWHRVGDVMREEYGEKIEPAFHNEDDEEYAETIGAVEEEPEEIRYEIPVETSAEREWAAHNLNRYTAAQPIPKKERTKEEKAAFSEEKKVEEPVFLDEPV